MLTKDQIIQADDKRFADVEVPEWGGSVRIKTMSAKDRQQFQSSISTKGKVADDFMERLIICCLVDDKGKQIFEQADIKLLSDKSSVAINKIFSAAVELNGMTDKSVDQIKGE